MPRPHRSPAGLLLLATLVACQPGAPTTPAVNEQAPTPCPTTPAASRPSDTLAAFTVDLSEPLTAWGA